MTDPPRASSPYGPNTAAVRRFLQRLAGRPAADCIRAARAYVAAQGTPDFIAADRSLGIAIDRAGRGEARDAIVGPIVQLMAGHAGRPAAEGPSGSSADDLAESALGAALALIARDLIPDTTFATLYRPYAELIPVIELDDP